MSVLALRAAAERLGAPFHSLYYWRRTGLLSPGPGDLTFQDLVRIRFIAACRERGLSLQRIRKAIQTLEIQAQAPSAGDWSANLELHGLEVLRREADRLVQMETGQLFLPLGERRVLGFPAARELQEREELRDFEQRFLRELEGGDFTRIRRSLEQLLKVKPDHIAALIEFGNLCYEFKRNADALGYYQAALDIDANCVEALYNIANIHFRERRFAAAIRSFQRCLELDPEFPEAYYNLGLLYFNLRYFEHSRECLQTYLQLDPDSSWSEQARRYLQQINAAISLEEGGELFSGDPGLNPPPGAQ